MSKKRVHELLEVEGYDKDYKILLDKSSDKASKQMSLRKFMDLLLKYNNTSEPLILSSNMISEIYYGSNIEVHPHILGLDLSYELLGNPDWMVIDETGKITINALSLGNYSVDLLVSNIFGSSRISLDFKVSDNINLNGDNIIEVFGPSTYIEDSGHLYGQVSGDKLFESYIGKPLLSNMDGIDSLYFDGNEMTLNSLNTLGLSEKLFKGILICFKPDMARNHGPLIGSFLDGHSIDLYKWKGKNCISFDGNSRERAKCTFDGLTYSNYVRNNTIIEYSDTSWNILYVEYEHLQLLKYLTIGSNYPKFPIGSRQYRGLIGDIIIFGSSLDESKVLEYIRLMKNKYE